MFESSDSTRTNKLNVRDLPVEAAGSVPLESIL